MNRQDIIEEKFVPAVDLECQRIARGGFGWTAKTYASLEDIFLDWREGYRFAPTFELAKEIDSIRQKKWHPKEGDSFVAGASLSKMYTGVFTGGILSFNEPMFVAPSYIQFCLLLTGGLLPA